MSDDVNALIAEARGSYGDAEELLVRLADALEAAQQAPAVDREALAGLLAVEMAMDGPDNETMMDFALRVMERAWASGTLQDAAEVWDEGAGRMYEFCQDEAATSDPDRLPTQPVNPYRAQQVREGNA